MGVERLEVLLRNVASGETIEREWSKAEMLRSVAWIKRMNTRGNNIYVRPSGEHGLALLDSLLTESLASMRRKGFSPAISVEIAGNEFQAWVKLSDRALAEPLRRLAEAGLARAFGGAESGVVRDGYGLLAGCANHGRGPDGPEQGRYVLAHGGRVEIGTQVKAYVEYVKERLLGVAKEQERMAQFQRLPDLSRPQTRGR